MPILTRPQKFDSIDDIKQAIAQSKEDFKILKKHWARLMEMYEDFEDVIVRLEKRLYQLENNIEPDDIKELRAKVERLEANNISLTKKTREAKKVAEADSISDLIDEL